MSAVTHTLLLPQPEEFQDSAPGHLEEEEEQENLPLPHVIILRARMSRRIAMLVVCLLALFGTLLGTKARANASTRRGGHQAPTEAITKWSINQAPSLASLAAPKNKFQNLRQAATVMPHEPLTVSEIYDHCGIEMNVDYWVDTANNLALLKVESRKACARECLRTSVLAGVTGNSSCRSWTWDRRQDGDAGYNVGKNCYLKRNVHPGRTPHPKRDSGYFCAALFQDVPAPVAKIGLTGLLAGVIGTLLLLCCLGWVCCC